MLKNFFSKLFGTKHEHDIKSLLPIVKTINSLEPQLKALSDDELKAQTLKFKKLLENGATLNDILPEAFATVREASSRVLNMRHFDVQMMGGIVLHEGKISEMKTGEGKTLTATLPLYLNALAGKGSHLVTVNDYLARRDSAEMGRLYNFLGLTCGVIVANMEDEERRTAYNCDITYGTNNEFAFDYLRDNMKFSLNDYVQRDYQFCIVDEVDSILIDEARTPLIISGPSEGDTALYATIDKVIPQLTKGTHYTVDEKAKTAVLNEEGIVKVQEILKIQNMFDIKHVEILHHMNQALRAHALFVRDVDYVVKDDKVVIVDEFTGRLKDGSRWSDGLHQAVEAKEGVQVKSENQTLASITFQNFFKLYPKLAGMTGTADTEAEEFQKIYNLDVVVIPTNVPMIRVDEADVVYKNKKAKYKAVANLIKSLYDKGQPVLVGTISIDNSELLSKKLQELKIPHQVLNAKQHEREALIIQDAGKKGSITIATNMAGRGTDIKLTPETVTAGGLYILGTERHESRRIDNQLRGRSGRQGDPGRSKFFLSLEDDLMRIFGSDRISSIMGTLGMEEDEPIEHKMISNAIAKAQKKVESHNFDIRKHLLDFDNVMNEQRKVIYKLRRDILKDIDNFNYELIMGFIADVCENIETTYLPKEKVGIDKWPWDEIKNGFQNTFNAHHIEINATECSNEFQGDLVGYLVDRAQKIYNEKMGKYEKEILDAALREITLGLLDQHWKEHLLAMDHLKEGINLRAYAQKDPLSEYKRDSFGLFEEMRMTIKKSVIENIFSVQLYTKDEIEEMRAKQQAILDAQLEAHRKAVAATEEKNQKTAVNRQANKVGRNELCPCGSGKKFKFCHGA